MPGIFIISLDLELIWGVRDKRNIENYGKNILNARKAIPQILDLFNKYGIHCTWAIVGMLFANNKDELTSFLPVKKPSYNDPMLSSYTYLDEVAETEEKDPYHYAGSLIEHIRKYPGQEIGSHSFSHYYCKEKGQSNSEFEEDILSAVKIAEKDNLVLRSFVFPRNQIVPEYLQVLNKMGFSCYRGNPDNFTFSTEIKRKYSVIQRILRLTDSYINLYGHHTYSISHLTENELINIPSSRFLRPFNPKLKLLEGLKINRVIKDMSYAARRNEVYHLWWHPHNFGANTETNMMQLEKILDHYSILKNKYGFLSMNMGELADCYKI